MPKVNVFISRYEMQSRQGLNSRSHSTVHNGALLRVDVDEQSGYGCLHPWQELGDASLEQLINELKQGRMSRQVRCALHSAKVDREARAKGVSLFDGLLVPDSHATIVGGVDRVALAVEQGFDTVKLKMGRDVDADIDLIKKVYQKFPTLKLRLDFNAVIGAGELIRFIMSIGEGARSQIDFLEDPCSSGDSMWHELRDKYGVKTALDRGVGIEAKTIEGGQMEYDYSVLKPAINRVDVLCDQSQMEGRNVVITSYMDHPIGQCYAAYIAGTMANRYLGLVDKRCGLMTHGLYETTAYTERLGEKTPHWKKPQDNGNGSTGLGFDDLLEAEEWLKI